MDRYEEGRPSWAELTTPDPIAAAHFYQQVFGWTYDEVPGRRQGRLICVLRGRRVAALNSSPGSATGTAEPASWTPYIGVSDARRTAERVFASGGSVLTPPDGPTAASRTAVLADPSGARFAVFQGDHFRQRAGSDGRAGGAGGAGQAGTFSWGELITDDVEASAAFYGAVFGWTATPPEGPLDRREWQLKGTSVSGLLPRPPAMPAGIPPYWDVYFSVSVSDPGATAEAVRGLGGTVLMAATVVERGTIAVLTDPCGAVFTVTDAAR